MHENLGPEAQRPFGGSGLQRGLQLRTVCVRGQRTSLSWVFDCRLARVSCLLPHFNEEFEVKDRRVIRARFVLTNFPFIALV